MKIRDIVNRDIVTLTNCDQEPIHIPGSIQPHGFLVAFKKSDQRVDFCSGNIHDFITLRHEQVLTKPVKEVFGAELTEQIFQFISRQTEDFSMPFSCSINKQLFSVTFHEREGLCILEFEPGMERIPEPAVVYRQTRKFASYMEQSATLQQLCQRIAEETRTITGYDRVMIYRFDKAYNGEVYAESRREDIEPFLGLHYPHTDIPVQARELYKQNLLRLIVDVNYAPVPIFTVDDQPDKNLNLSQSALRSVSPIHVQYLHNIGVGATLTISLMHEQKLWGLIACHHYSPKYLDNFTRISARLQGHFITSQINVRQVAEQHALTLGVQAAVDRMTALSFSTEPHSLNVLVQQPDLMQLCHASGVAIITEHALYTNGLVPEEEAIRKLVTYLRAYSPKSIIHTSKLVDIYPEGDALRDTAAGVLYHSLGEVLNMGIIWFRPETIKEVKWAGDPNKAVMLDANGLSPRKSFALWKEEIKFQSSDWQEPEISASTNFAHYLERQAHLNFLMVEENKYRSLSEKLKDTNAELENINWISTHDLKEPLRKIQIFTSRILEATTEKLPDTVIDSIKKVNSSAIRMQTLIADILEYSKLRHVDAERTAVPLNRILTGVMDELGEDIEAHRAVITIHALPEISCIPFLVHQLFINLVRNSLKFSKKQVVPTVTIRYEGIETPPLPQATGTYYKLVVEDNGIGFPEKFNDSIFNVFTRLHGQADYGGSGVGLALCRKIMQNHEGFIVARGKPEEGATFILYFPVR